MADQGLYNSLRLMDAEVDEPFFLLLQMLHYQGHSFLQIHWQEPFRIPKMSTV